VTITQQQIISDLWRGRER